MSKDELFSLENAGKSTSKTSTEDLSVDYAELEKVLQQTLAVTKDCTIEMLTELYVRLEKKISLFKDKWDRTSLPQVCNLLSQGMLKSSTLLLPQRYRNYPKICSGC